jgi:hypothetical protein
MSSFLTQAFLLEKYGPLLTAAQLGEVLHLGEKSVMNHVSAETLGVVPAKRRPLLFHAADVARLLDSMRSAI